MAYTQKVDQRTANRVEYQTRKAAGICAQNGCRRKAREGKTTCFDCSENRSLERKAIREKTKDRLRAADALVERLDSQLRRGVLMSQATIDLIRAYQKASA